MNPVVKNDLTVQLSGPLPNPGNLDLDDLIDDYTVFVRGPNSYKRQLNIVSYVENGYDSKLIVRFNGAPSGNYKLVISGPDNEEITPVNGLDLETKIEVT